VSEFICKSCGFNVVTSDGWCLDCGAPETFNHHDYLTTEQAREYAGRLLAAAIQVETARGTA
jgi:predicted ATP-dependent serine protease